MREGATIRSNPRAFLGMMELFHTLTMVGSCIKIDGTAHQKKNVNFIAWLKGLSGREQRLEEEIKTGL